MALDAISRTINYGFTIIDHTVKKVMENPSAVKKVLQITSMIFAGFDLYQSGEVKKRDITDATKGAVDLLGVHTIYKYFIYWVNPFSKNNLDNKILQKTIEASMGKLHLKSDSHTLAVLNRSQKENAGLIYSRVMQQSALHSKGDVIAVLRKGFEEIGYESSEIDSIVERVIVQKKSRPIVQTLYMVCFSFADTMAPIKTILKWSAVDLSRIAATIGSSRVGVFVLKLGSGPVLGAIASAGLILTIGESSYKLVIHILARNNAATPEEREKASKEMRAAIFGILTGVTDLAAAALPLLFALNPPVILALGIIAKGTGLIIILVS